MCPTGVGCSLRAGAGSYLLIHRKGCTACPLNHVGLPWESESRQEQTKPGHSWGCLPGDFTRPCPPLTLTLSFQIHIWLHLLDSSSRKILAVCPFPMVLLCLISPCTPFPATSQLPRKDPEPPWTPWLMLLSFSLSQSLASCCRIGWSTFLLLMQKTPLCTCTLKPHRVLDFSKPHLNCCASWGALLFSSQWIRAIELLNQLLASTQFSLETFA